MRAGMLGLVVALWTAGAAAQEPVRLETTVGMTGKLEGVVLPGPELKAKDYTDRKIPVVIQKLIVYPHGTDFRYDIDYHGLDPGEYDLTQYLVRVDGKPAVGLPPVRVKVNPIRPPGQVEPNQLVVEKSPWLGGYRLLLIVLGVLWVVGFVGIVLSFFFPRRKDRALSVGRPVTLADRLRPLVEGAIAGKLTQPELAGLERGLLAYWRRRLGLEAVEPAEAMAELRKHPDAGPLLRKLEEWLHRPGPPAPVDVGALLAPYRDLPPDAADLGPAA